MTTLHRKAAATRQRLFSRESHGVSTSHHQYRPILDLAAVGLTVACYGIARLAFNAIGNRVFGVALVGAVNVALSTALLVSLPVSAGIAPAVLRFVPMWDGADRRRQQAWLFAAAGVWVVMAACVLAALRWWFADAAWLPLPAGVVEAWMAAYSLYSIGRAWLFATGRLRSALGVEASALGLFTVALMFAGRSRMAYWAPLIVYYLPGVAVALGIAFVSLGALARSRQDTELASFAGFSLLGSVASLGVTYASTVVVALIADIRDAGMWATLVSAASPFLLVPRSMSMLFLPRLSRETPTDGDRFRDLSAVHQLLSSGLAAMFLGPAVILGRHVAPAVLGLQYDSRTALIWVLVCSAVYATTRGEPIVTATAALGRVRWSSGSSITVGVLVVLFWWLAAPHYATVAVATGYTAFTVGVPIILALVWWIQDRGEPRRPRLLPNLGDAAFGACLALDLLGGRSVVVDVVFAMAVGIAIAFWSWRKYRTAAGLAVLAAEVVPRTTKQPRS